VITKNFESICLYSFVPCFLLYSSFSADEAYPFAVTLVTFLAVGVSACIYQLVVQDRTRRIQSYLLQDGSKKFSKMFFSSPDWTLTKPGEGVDSKTDISLSMQNMIKEERVKAVIS
jgi:hypothetical protein